MQENLDQVQKHLRTASYLSMQIKMKAKTDEKTLEDLEQAKLELQKMSQLATRRGRVASIAMSASRAAQAGKNRLAGALNDLHTRTLRLRLQSEAKQAIIDAHVCHIQRQEVIRF